jgi:hypothetical protein
MNSSIAVVQQESGLSRRKFLTGMAGIVAGRVVLKPKSELSAQEPPNRISARLISQSDFNIMRDNTLRDAKTIFSDLKIWISLSEQDRIKFCELLHDTMLTGTKDDPEALRNNFLNNLKNLLTSNLISDSEKGEIFKLNNYLMLDLALRRINIYKPSPEKSKDFLSEIISESVKIIQKPNQNKRVSLEERVRNTNTIANETLALYTKIKNRHFPSN